MSCSKYPVVVLSKDQLEFAAKVADELHDKLRKRGLKDAHGATEKDLTRNVERMAAAAELAVANFLGVPWTASLPDCTSRSPDIGSRTQVRSSGVYRRSHHLIVRKRDLEKYGNVPFVLVTYNDKSEFMIRGWAMSFDVRDDDNYWDGGNSGRPRAYFYKEKKLLHIGELTDP